MNLTGKKHAEYVLNKRRLSSVSIALIIVCIHHAN
jgi:hypothetical protein